MEYIFPEILMEVLRSWFGEETEALLKVDASSETPNYDLKKRHAELFAQIVINTSLDGRWARFKKLYGFAKTQKYSYVQSKLSGLIQRENVIHDQYTAWLPFYYFQENLLPGFLRFLKTKVVEGSKISRLVKDLENTDSSENSKNFAEFYLFHYFVTGLMGQSARGYLERAHEAVLVYNQHSPIWLNERLLEKMLFYESKEVLRLTYFLNVAGATQQGKVYRKYALREPRLLDITSIPYEIRLTTWKKEVSQYLESALRTVGLLSEIKNALLTSDVGTFDERWAEKNPEKCVLMSDLLRESTIHKIISYRVKNADNSDSEIPSEEKLKRLECIPGGINEVIWSMFAQKPRYGPNGERDNLSANELSMLNTAVVAFYVLMMALYQLEEI